MARLINYLNNKDILKEIHKSKISYCSYTNSEFSEYDIIVKDISEIPSLLKETAEEMLVNGKNETIIGPSLAKIARANRLTTLAQDALIVDGKKSKSEIKAIDPDTITDQEIIFRVMTWDHIPEAAPVVPKLTKGKKNKIVIEDDLDLLVTEYDEIIPEIVAPSPKYVKVNFPPFQHYKLNNNNVPEVVGKSHWIGDITTGSFSKDHGKITNKLAMMYMKLCERYATRSNWRGYCVDIATEALTQRGWTGIDQIIENDIILSYADGDLKWSKIKSIYRGEFDGKMHYLTTNSMDALVTPEHKFITGRGLVKAELILESDTVILNGNAVNDTDQTKKIYVDELVELIGQIVTDGCCQFVNGAIKAISVYQNTGPKADRIRECLTTLELSFSEKIHKNNNICFYIYKKDATELYKLIPSKNLTMEFITALTKDQRELLINTMIDGDGWRSGPNKEYMRYTHKSKHHIDLFRILCTIHGLRSNLHYNNHISFGKLVDYYTMNIFTKKKNKTNGERIDFHGGKRSSKELKTIGRGKEHHPNEPTTYYKGTVWCPETEYGCFMARRNDKIYLTGNTYIDEMKSQALLQLSQIGLQFDESKSANPFAYYTMALQNSFTRVLNIEKRNQNIRDDILEMNNLTPSYSRQNTGNSDNHGTGHEE